MALYDRFPAEKGALLIVDLQERLLELIRRRDLAVANCIRLVRAAQAIGMPCWATEQNPSRLGGAVASLTERIPSRPGKMAFSALSSIPINEQIHGQSIGHVTVAGIETHVCVAQTALDLLSKGFRVQIPADAVASRSDLDRKTALGRLSHAGAVVTSTEAVLFEWIESAEHPAFKTISGLIKDFVRPRKVPRSRPMKTPPN